MTEIRSRDGIWVYFSVVVVGGRCGDCTGATETVRALRRLYGRYEDCTDATKTVRALRRLYGRYGDCTGSSSSMAGLMTEIWSRDGIWVYFSFFLYVC